MSANFENEPPNPGRNEPGAMADESPLEHVVDDLTPREQCLDWIDDQMTTRARTPEQIAAELREQGWDPDEAESMVEAVRKATRAERGVVTRDDVVRDANRRYRQSWAPSWFSGLPTLSSGIRLLGGLRNLFALKKVRDDIREQKRDESE